MKPLDDATRQFVLNIIARTQDLSLATVRPDGFPQATVVSYANDGLTLYVGIGLDSQKAHNIRQNPRVSLTITPAYRDWMHIEGVSMAGLATLVDNRDEMEHAADCMLRRFPEIKEWTSGVASLPWAGAIFVKIVPTIISVLDYQKGFGHTELFAAN